MKYLITIQPTALKMLRNIADTRVRQKLVERIDRLADAPLSIGKPLIKDLSGYRSVRAVGQRYRIIYSVQEAAKTVSVIAIGIRKEGDRADIYALAQRLVRLGLAE